MNALEPHAGALLDPWMILMWCISPLRRMRQSCRKRWRCSSPWKVPQFYRQGVDWDPVFGRFGSKRNVWLLPGVLQDGRWVGAWLHGVAPTLSSPSRLGPTGCLEYEWQQRCGLGACSMRSPGTELSPALSTRNSLLSENQSPQVPLGPASAGMRGHTPAGVLCGRRYNSKPKFAPC